MSQAISRKATFTTVKTNKGRVFTPVNKPAKTVVRIVKGLSKNANRKNYPALTVTELKATNGKGSYKFYEYQTVNGNKYGVLKAIKF